MVGRQEQQMFTTGRQGGHNYMLRKENLWVLMAD